MRDGYYLIWDDVKPDSKEIIKTFTTSGLTMWYRFGDGESRYIEELIGNVDNIKYIEIDKL